MNIRFFVIFSALIRLNLNFGYDIPSILKDNYLYRYFGGFGFESSFFFALLQTAFRRVSMLLSVHEKSCGVQNGRKWTTGNQRICFFGNLFSLFFQP